MRFWITVALALTAAPAMAADQFDLVCKMGQTPVRYRIDLAKGEACDSDCARVWKMGLVTDGELRLMDTVKNYPAEYPPQIISVNRQSGVLSHWIGGGRQAINEEGKCEPAPFTGFPASKF